MPTQLTFDFSSKPLLEDNPITTKDMWLNVSDIARGVGFTETVHVSTALHERLEYRHAMRENDYDQLLYDALWLAHFKLALDDLTYATFNFTTEQKHREPQAAPSIALRLRVETQKHSVWLGLLEDF